MSDKAVILARASTAKQVIDGDTLEEQIILCSDYIVKQGWTKDKVFKFAESGRKDEREFFEEVLDYCLNLKNQVRYVVFKNISRFTRAGGTTYLNLKDKLLKAGVELRDIYETIRPPVNTMESYGLEYKWSKYSPSQSNETYEAEKAKDFVRDVLTQMIGAEVSYARKGYWNRRPVYGFSNQKVETEDGKKRNILVPNIAEAQYVKMIYELRANTALTDSEIVKKINEMGYLSRIYTKREQRTKRAIGKGGSKPLTVKHMQVMIVKPVYAGVICEKWTLYKPVKAQFDGLVDIDTFNRANRGKVTISGSTQEPSIKYGKEQKDYGNIKRRSRENPLFPFKDVVSCPKCGHSLHGSSSKGRSGQLYPAYHHTGKHKLWRVPKKDFEDTIHAFSQQLKFSDDFIKLFEATFLEVWKEQRINVVKESELAEAYVAELLTKQRTTLETIKITSSEAVRKALEKEYDDFDVQIKSARESRVTKEKNELNVKEAVRYATYLMEHPDDLLINTDNYQQQKQIFSLFFNELPNYEQLTNGTANLSPVFALKSNQNVSKSDLVTPSGFEPELTG